MRPFFSMVVVLTVASAHAQDLNLGMGGAGLPSLNVHVDTGPRPAAPPPAPAPPRPPPVRVVGADQFTVDYDSQRSGAQQIRVVSPEGAQVQVWNEEQELEGTWAVPFIFKGTGGRYYRFIIFWADGQVLFDRKVEVRTWEPGELRQLRAPAPAPAPPLPAPPQANVVVVANQPPPPPPPTAPAPAGMDGASFAALLQAVKSEAFSQNKLGAIESAASSAFFTVDQVGQLVDVLSFSADKVQAVTLTRARLVDPGNGFKLLNHFPFSGDKEKVRGILR